MDRFSLAYGSRRGPIGRIGQKAGTKVMSAAMPFLVLAALALAGCHPRAASAVPVLKIASQKGGTKSLMLASHTLDGAPYKVEWSEFPSAQALLEALSAGAVDAGSVGDAPFMFAYATGAKIKAVQATRASGGGASTAILVRANSAIRTAADLKGRRIATGRGSVGHYLLLRVLETAGLTPKDVTVVFLNPGDAKAAFDSGTVDAWATWGPYVGLARLHDQTRIVADGRGLMHGIGFEAANDNAIARKRAQLTDFLARLAKAERWEGDHKAEYAAVMAKETGLPADVAFYTVSNVRSVATPINGSIIDEEKDTLGHYVKAGVITAPPDLAAALDTSFNSAAKP
jgi:sulfonate transport system substrate-binding protein